MFNCIKSIFKSLGQWIDADGFKIIMVGLCAFCFILCLKGVVFISSELAYISQALHVIANTSDGINKNILVTNNNVLEGIKTSVGLNRMMVDVMKAMNSGSLERDGKITSDMDKLFSSIALEIKLNKTRDAFMKDIANFAINIARNQAQEEALYLREVEQLRLLLIQRGEVERAARSKLEYKLMQCNIMLYNNKLGAQGSGISINYKGKFYILSAAHLVTSEKEDLELCENGITIAKVRVVKADFERDLLLLETIDKDIQPHFWSYIADEAPVKSNEVYVVGNPIGIEDVLSIARVIGYKEPYFYYLDHSYFGSSGGGIFDLEGRLVGTISHLIPYDPNPFGIVRDRKPQFVIHGACSLNSIKQFMMGV